MAVQTLANSLADLRERGIYPEARIGSTVRPHTFGTVCAVRADSAMIWVTFDGYAPELVTEHQICGLFLVETDEDLGEGF